MTCPAERDSWATESTSLPGHQADTGSSQIDYQRLEAWWGPDPLPLLKRLAPVFLRTFPDQLVELNAALVDRDRKALKIIAHTMKSSCGSLGIMAISEHCQSIESAVESDDLIEVAHRLEQVVILGDQVIEELSALVA